MNHKRLSVSLVLVLSTVLTLSCYAADNNAGKSIVPKEGTVITGPRTVELNNLFTDRMVFQRETTIPLWGTAKPGEKISATMSKEWVSTQADNAGKWRIVLPEKPVGGPYEVIVKGEQGEPIVLKDILVGDVFLCSGQSNMNMTLKACLDAEKEIARAYNPQVRLLRAYIQMNHGPYDRLDLQPSGSWQYCGDSSTPNFSGVGYYFGKELNKAKKVPVGLVQASVGGTPIETWISYESLLKFAPLRTKLEKMGNKAIDMPASIAKFNQDKIKWFASFSRYEANQLGYQLPTYDDSTWRTDILPSKCPELDNMDGSWWYRKVVDIPAAWSGKNLVLDLGTIDEIDDVWFNGAYVNGRSVASTVRSYTISSTLVKPGKNLIALRVIDLNYSGGFTGAPADLKLSCGTVGRISLAGDWKSHAGTNLKNFTPYPENPFSYNRESGFYNGMINPLVGLPIRGVLWYQGESNAQRASQYEELLRLWIADWRAKFGPVPFFIVQLPNFNTPANVSTHEQWVQIMEAQAKVVASTDSTALIVTNDVGMLDDIHPTHKEPVGKRLALAAQKLIYGDNVAGYCPSFKSMTKEGSKLKISFNNIGSGLKVTGKGPIKGFEVCGADGKFVPATAVLDKDMVIVSNAKIKDPQQVRYNWTDKPMVNLFSKEGLPVGPFRTDSF